MISSLIILTLAGTTLGLPARDGLHMDTSLYARDEDGFKYFDFPVYSTYNGIFCDLCLGTPGQGVTLMVDTGSSDMTLHGFDANKSSTAVTSDTPFELIFGDRRDAKGFYAEDRVHFQGGHLENVTFVPLAEPLWPYSGVVGFGPIAGESQDAGYTNFPYKFKESGYVDKVAYSVWMDPDTNDDTVKGASIIFGGLDHSKFQSDKLAKVPMVKTPMVNFTDYSTYTPDAPAHAAVLLTGMSIENEDQNSFDTLSNAALPAVIDIGATSTTFPKDIIEAILLSFFDPSEVSYDSANNGYSIPRSLNGTLTFNFSGATFSVPLESLCLGYSDSPGYLFEFQVNPYPMVPDSPQALVLIGRDTLKHAYLVYDLEDEWIAIGQAATDASTATKSIDAIDGYITEAPSYSASTTNFSYDLSTANPSEFNAGPGANSTTLTPTSTPTSVEASSS